VLGREHLRDLAAAVGAFRSGPEPIPNRRGMGLRPPMVWDQILNIKTSPSIANKGDHSMPTLQNPRHERFAQELVIGKTADAAYVLAGYRANRAVMLLG
jgi:hypothetical protein